MGYHKAVKKLIGLSMHESNHFACQEAMLLLFNHFINKLQISAFHRFISKPCEIVKKASVFFKFFSVFAETIAEILHVEYDFHLLFENDIDAVHSRIQYKQNHEMQMRETW